MILEKNLEPFELLKSTQTDDGRGGRRNLWAIAGEFDGAAVIGQALHDRARQTDVTQAQEHTAKPMYSLLTRKAVSLPFLSWVRRKRDGKTFRIKSDPADACTPIGARLDLRMHAAEPLPLPDPDNWEEAQNDQI